jgi:hypothetical protein
LFSAYFVKHLCLFLFFCSFQIVSSAWASDVEKEKFWKTHLSKNIKFGQAIDLEAEESNFFAIYNKQNLLHEKGSVILLHDKAGHPDWKDVIKPLRIQLTDHGWNTLSIQMPLKTKLLKEKEEIDAFYKKANTRLDSAISFLKDKNSKSIFLIAYGSNSFAVLNYMNENPNRIINGLVLIGMASSTTENTIDILEKIKSPVLDIFGSKDFDSVILTAPQRQSAAKRGGNIYYAQRKIDYADHFFKTESETLVKRVHSWMVSIISR